MKLSRIFGFIAASLLLASCESAELFDEQTNAGDNTICITGVSQSGFVSNASSRATYSDVYATRFEEGDRLGLILVDEAGNQIANVPFSYTADGKWNNDRNQLYLSEVAKVLAYYPYDETLAADVTDIASLKSSVSVAADQSDKADFTASDLLVCELFRPGDTFNIDFSHAFSLLCFSSKATVSDGNRNFEYSVALDGLKVNIGNDVYTPCDMNGGYVLIVKDATDLQPEVFKYTYRRFGEDRATKTLTAAVSTNAGTFYSFPCPSAGSETSALQAGDYYCVTADNGAVVMLPAGASAIPEGLICQGIVFHVMDNAAFAAYAAGNGIDASGYHGIGGRHGMIVSLRRGGLILSGYTPGDASHNDFLKSVFASSDDCGDTDASLGYKLTKMMSAAYGNGNAGVTFTGLDGFSASLSGCTGWYIPSFNELKYLIRGSGSPSVVSLAGQDMINVQLATASGELLEGNMPSVSYKKDDGFCIMQNGEEMGWHGVPDGEMCRPICAF